VTQSTCEFDVAVVGASIGGCTAAALFARRGLRVALIESSPDAAAHKKVCTHFLQPIGMSAIRRLGLAERIEAAGGVKNDLELYTQWGWIRSKDQSRLAHGYNIRRQTLDPLLRKIAIETPGVHYFPGVSATGALRDARGRVRGIATRTAAGRREFHARLTVAADGRHSPLARSAGIAAHKAENDRFTYYAYYRGLPLGSSVSSRYWHLDPHLAYAFKNDGDTTLLGVFFPKQELAKFKRDPENEFRRFWDAVPGAPPIGDAQPIDGLKGMTEMPNQWRPAAAPGIALIGDAAMTTDPIWGTGCGFAFASAEWLVDACASAMTRGEQALDRALRRYRRIHRSRTRGHFWHISSFSRIRSPNLIERFVFSAAARDARMADRVLAYVGRTVGLMQLVSPMSLLRASQVHLQTLLARLLPQLENAAGSAPQPTTPPRTIPWLVP
jgi:flavin-dependent dehydrogenase